MIYVFDRARSEILTQLNDLVAKKLNKEQTKIIQNLIVQFYRTVSYEDIQNRSIDDLYGSILSLYDFIRYRKPGELKLRVYNPDIDINAWRSRHTVIEIINQDMPFMVDSILMEINRLGYTPYVTIHCGGMRVERNKTDELVTIYPYSEEVQTDGTLEAPIYLEINRITDDIALKNLQDNLITVLNDVRCAVEDWSQMQQRVQQSLKNLEEVKPNLAEEYHEELEESKDYLAWIIDKNFILLGTCDYEIKTKAKEKVYVAIPGSDLGILSQTKMCSLASKLDVMARDPKLFKDKSKILTLSKTNINSNIHRPVYMESVGIPIANDKGKIIGERIILGMYTSIAYNRSSKDIPFLRQKVAQIVKLTNFRPRSHAWKSILNILETLPRDDLFQGTVDELLDISLGIYNLQERKRIRLFARRDVNGRFMSCYVYLPRDRFNTKLLRAMQTILDTDFQSLESTFTTRFSDSVLARIHYILRLDTTHHNDYNLKDTERKLIEVGRSWEDDINTCLLDYFGEEQGASIMLRYSNAFPLSYRENFNAVTALYDIRHIEKLCDSHSLELNIYKPIDDFSDSIRFKVYQRGDVIAISDALPILENMGLRVISERPYRILRKDGDTVWINDFTMVHSDVLKFELQQLKEPFQEAFAKIWFGDVENDGFNKLILRAGLSWREIMMLRAYAKYFRQMGIAFSQTYIEQTLVNHPEITKQLVELFKLRFDPLTAQKNQLAAKKINDNIQLALEKVESLDDDRIMRYYLKLMAATLRTNYYQLDEHGNEKSYLSIKLNSKEIPDLPLPRPMFEIFVYATRFEGVHLRGAKVARGGIRWSDRFEDFRSEVLGLMKAQQVKNAVIVPSGAKGGFVTKCLSPDSSREEIIEEGISCYRNFIRGLLDITDNLVAAEVVPPTNVYRYDDDDTYLVVAADKGTATFSDLANSIAQQYGFWLNDAFASGGSTGYDHKKMGITARGAWESVKRHFREIDIDIQTQDFTCIGIGDMSGDVFGNGMLLSKHTKLIAAFNHLHIFLDPNPDPKKSYRERERLFNLPRSNWTDYDKNIISMGGGVYSRADKFIDITPEIKEALNISENRMEPNKLLACILKAPVDLLWNGGIGTFVKSEKQSHEDVSDRTNNAFRINASELRCKVVGEGGNLGFTQTARIEYALRGGKIYTDFIDNSGGVDCSDHEVNIKILLNEVVKNGEMTEKQRNRILEEMTDEVATLVLQNNYRQTQAISLADKHAARNLELHRRYIMSLEQSGKLNRSLEFLPNEQALLERKTAGQGLTRPGIAVLLAYSKITCKEEILRSEVPEDSYLSKILKTAFPSRLGEEYSEPMYNHSLRREIIATQLSNNLVNEMGFSFIYRIYHETGADTALIVRAYMIVREIFEVPKTWEAIEALDNKVAADVQIDMMILYIRLLRRSTRWTLKLHRLHLDIEREIKTYLAGVQELYTCIPSVLQGNTLAQYQKSLDKFVSQGVPRDLAKRIANVRPMFSALDIVDAALQNGVSVTEVASIYFSIDEQLELNWIRMQVIAQKVENHWDALTRESLRDDLDWQQKKLTISILNHKAPSNEITRRIDSWINEYLSLVNRWRNILGDLHNSANLSFTMLFVAIRELLDLTQTSLQTTKSSELDQQ